MARGIFSGSTWDLPWRHVELVPRPGLRPQPPALGVWSLHRWFTREVRGLCVIISLVLWGSVAHLCSFVLFCCVLCWVSLAARGFRAVGSDHPCPLCWKADSCPLGHQGSPLCVIFKCRCLMMVQLAPCPDHVLSPWGCLTSSENDPEPYLSKAVRAPLGSERVSKRLWDGPGWGWTGPGSLVGPRRDHFFLQ